MGYAIARRATGLAIFLLCTGQVTAQSQEPSDLPVTRLSPKLRPEERSQDYYNNIRCDRLHTAVAETDDEKRALDARKHACLERYKAFTPRSSIQ